MADIPTIDLTSAAGVAVDGVAVETRMGASPVYAVRSLPTEGISTDIRGITHVDEALSKAGLNYKVVQVPISYEGRQVPNRLANIREDTRDFIEVVSPRYIPFQNYQAYSFLEGMLNSGALELQNAGQFDYGSVFIEAKTPKNITVLGDEFYPFALIKNSHDGTSGVKVCFTFTRVVCKNTLAAAVAGAPRVWQAKHLRSLEGRMEDAKRMLEVMDTYTHEYPIVIEKLNDINLTEDNIVSVMKKLFPLAEDAKERKIANAAHTAKEILTIYNKTPDLKRFNGTALGFYYAIGDWATHSTPKKDTANWRANRLNLLADGHPLMDLAQKELLAIPA